MIRDKRFCIECDYPLTKGICRNPGCFANPNVSEAVKAKWRVERATRAAEVAERERIQRIRSEVARMEAERRKRR